jgi:2,2-dialkylglycine decarboxylase (pyruvate)
LKPDIIAIFKHFGGGLRISAVCLTADIAKRAAERGYFATLSHATEPLLCAAGEESLDIVLNENMPRKSMQIERWIKSAFSKMVKEFEWIGDIRGHGVLLGVELATD